MPFYILILEDEPAQVIAFKVSLERFLPNAKFNILREGYEYLKKLDSSERLPDLAILDVRINSSELDGFDVLKKIRQHEFYDYLPVIMFSVSDSVEDKLKSLELGATGYYQKPPLSLMGLHLKNISDKYIRLEIVKPNIESKPKLVKQEQVEDDSLWDRLDKMLEDI